MIKISKKEALAHGTKWLEKILGLMYKTCYVFEPKISDAEKREFFFLHLESMARKATKNFDDKREAEKIFIMTVIAIEAAADAAKKCLLGLTSASATKC